MPSTERLPGIAETSLNSHLVSLRKESTSLYWFGLCLGAVVFAMTPVFTVGIPLPAFWLPRKLLDRHASRIVHSKSYMIRQAVNLVQLNAGLCWGRDDRIRARFNLDPLSLPLDMLSGRLPGGGVQLMERLNEFRDIAIWVQVGRAESVGSIHAGLTGRPVVKYTLNQSDMHRFREGMYKTAETHIAAGAHSVLPAIYGLPYRLGRDEIQKIREAPLDPRNYVGVVSHLFGGCVMGSDPSRSVCDGRGRVHGYRNLYIADASAIPTNLGVNPQHTIMGLAWLWAEQMLEDESS